MTSIETQTPPAQDRVIVRRFSPCGPCLTEGKLVKSTARFYVYREWTGMDRFDGRERRVAKHSAHIEPCCSCTDHPSTVYPHGYMD